SRSSYCDSIREMIKRMALLAALFASACTSRQAVPAQAPSQNIDDFFRTFTDEWVQGNPNLAMSSRYFTGEEQDRLDRQLTAQTDAYHRARIQLAKRGLTELKKFDRRTLTDGQRLSAELVEWQLDMVVEEEPYLDFEFPLQQMNGVNVDLVEVLT